MMRAASVTGLVVAVAFGAGGTFHLTSPAFEAKSAIPARYTCDGRDVSPPLAWSNPPAGTRRFALIADDPDAPAGTWVHRVLWNIPGTARGLEANLPKVALLADGTRQGTTDFRRIGYGGPCSPAGTHRYYFKLNQAGPHTGDDGTHSWASGADGDVSAAIAAA